MSSAALSDRFAADMVFLKRSPGSATMTVLRRSKPLSNANLLREKVHGIIKEKSFAEGDFTLVSGRKSKYYLDMKPTLFSPEGATAVAELVLNELEDTRLDY